MFDVAGSLINALSRARTDLDNAGSDVSRTQTQLGSPRSDRVLAQAAGRAVFTEALLNAVHARLAEIKSVTHG
jgi:hypothetical protein